MTLHTVRAVCAHCNQTLPRAAFFRCPFCRKPIERETEGAEIICRRCNNPIPRAHAGNCPCTSIERRSLHPARRLPERWPE
ncbi:hypothetical protein D6850_07775 [Roseovarius spongiae]|uniref:Uncharacterized protein n=1 Tax=Roseovarius spongiae TaxID=2320272 RepID=A0A3A8AT93_9RHOB|nr:hypothetical protein [Roseovarius spongiae]RKF14769.1 hypothetical protein D6850_07775 [Roseovarius spongiae]